MVAMERVQKWEGYLASKGEKLVPASQHGRGQAADLSRRLIHRDLQHGECQICCTTLFKLEGGGQYGNMMIIKLKKFEEKRKLTSCSVSGFSGFRLQSNRP